MTPSTSPTPSADDADRELGLKIRRLQGPILVAGGSGFVGANLAAKLLKFREDVYATATSAPAWRLENLPKKNVIYVDLLIDSNVDTLFDQIKPRTVFDCVAYGAYSFESDPQLIYRTNFNLASRLLPPPGGRQDRLLRARRQFVGVWR